MEAKGQLYATTVLLLGKESIVNHQIGGWIVPNTSVYIAVKRKIAAVAWNITLVIRPIISHFNNLATLAKAGYKTLRIQ